MDMEKLKQWIDIANKFHGGDFWSDIFDQAHLQNLPLHPFAKSKQDPGAEPGFPYADVLISGHDTIVLIDLPGVAKEHVEVSFKGAAIYIKGHSYARYPNATPIRTERVSGSFERVIPLPEAIGTNNISAKFDNGLLEIRIHGEESPQTKIRID
ncbi:MAG TPA: Hsp20/alpha crystallin family protein [Bacilli bacterium]